MTHRKKIYKQSEVARRVGISAAYMHQLAHSKRKASPDVAVKLGKATKTSPMLWMFLKKEDQERKLQLFYQ